MKDNSQSFRRKIPNSKLNQSRLSTLATMGTVFQINFLNIIINNIQVCQIKILFFMNGNRVGSLSNSNF